MKEVRRCGPVPSIAVIHCRFYDLQAFMATLFSMPAKHAFPRVIWARKAWLTIRSYELLIAAVAVLAYAGMSRAKGAVRVYGNA